MNTEYNDTRKASNNKRMNKARHDKRDTRKQMDNARYDFNKSVRV